jgi:hypothetical protein
VKFFPTKDENNFNESSKKQKEMKATVVAAFALVAGFNVYNSQKVEGMMPDLVLADIEAKANTIGCETSYGSVLYYCIDWSVVTICTCGTSHPQHAKSYCPDKLCQ